MAASRSVIVTALGALLGLPSSAFAADQGKWNQERLRGTTPPWSQSASAVFDPARDRVVVFGGFDLGAAIDTTLHLQLNGRPRWEQPRTKGTPPARWDHTAVVDPDRDRMLVFGGIGTPEGLPVDLNSVWALDLGHRAEWESVAVVGAPPPARDAHSAIVDPIAKQMVIFGGGGAEGLLGDTWALALESSEWSRLAPGGETPEPRSRHSAIYDPLSGRMLVFGGVTFGGVLSNELWALSLGAAPTWTRLVPEGVAPSPRAGHRAIYDPVQRRMLLFGGLTEGAEIFSADLWELSLGDTLRWQRLEFDGPAPEGRFSPLMVRDDFERELVLAGGAAFGPTDDLWTLSLDGRNGRGPEGFTIGPNPARGQTPTLGFLMQSAGDVQVEILDVAGRRAWLREIPGLDAGWHTVKLDASLTAGVYWVRMRDRAWQRVERLVVLR